MLYCKPSKPTLTAALLLALITEHACKRENCYWNHEYRPRTVRSWFPHTDWLSLLQSYANSNKLNLIVNLCLWSFQSLVKDDSNINSLILSINSNNELNYLKTFECLKKKRSTVYGKLLFQSFNNWIKLVGCTKAVCPSPSGNNSAFLNGLQLCIFWIVSFALLCPYLPLYIVNLMSLSMWTNSLTKVGLPIFEWTVPRLFVHPRVEIMALLSMDSSYIFVNGFRYSIVSMSANVNYISEYMYVNYFTDKSCAAHLWVDCTKAVCPPPSGNNSAFVNGLQLHICE